MRKEEDARRTALAREQIGESLGLLILAADVLGLPRTGVALRRALRRLDREEAVSPLPDRSRDAAAARSAPGPAAPGPPRHPR